MLKLGDEVTIVSSATYSNDDWSTHVGKTTMITHITASNGIRYGLKGVASGTDMWSADDLQPTGRKLLESSIGKKPRHAWRHGYHRDCRYTTGASRIRHSLCLQPARHNYRH